MTDRLFIQTGATPPRGHMADVRVVRPKKSDRKGKTILVTGNPYRRVYEDAEGFFIKYYGSKCRVYLAYDYNF